VVHPGFDTRKLRLADDPREGLMRTLGASLQAVLFEANSTI
jgi:hypothetical protein